MFNNVALQFFFFQKFLFYFSDNQMKAWAIYLFLIKWKWNPDFFWQTNRGLLLKLIHGRKIEVNIPLKKFIIIVFFLQLSG